MPLAYFLRRVRALPRCPRGATLVEYIVVVGFVALLAMVGYQRFGGSLRSTVGGEAQKVALLEATNPGGGPNGGPGLAPPPSTNDGTPAPEGAFCTRSGCTSPGNCFPAETPVLTSEGARAIETVHRGDLVYTRDESTGSVTLAPVVRTFVTADAPLVEVRIAEASGAIHALRATPGHPVWTRDRRWIRASELYAGETLADARDADLHVVDVRPLAEHATVYNFEVEATHSYFAGDLAVWVHNICEGSMNIGGTDVPGTLSASGTYFMPDQLDEGQAATPADGDDGILYVQTGNPSPSSSVPSPDHYPFTLNGVTFVPYVPAGPVPNDCLHTAEEINAGCELTYAAANYSHLPGTPGRRPWVFGGNNTTNINHTQQIADHDPLSVDQHAAPDVGQAYVIVNMNNPPQGDEPNFHAEAVVAQDGPDRITLSTAADDQWAQDGSRIRRPVYRIYSIDPNSGHTFSDDMSSGIPHNHVVVVQGRPNIAPAHHGTPLPGPGLVQPPQGPIYNGHWTPTPP